jgi:hypothetical protein
VTSLQSEDEGKMNFEDFPEEAALSVALSLQSSGYEDEAI